MDWTKASVVTAEVEGSEGEPLLFARWGNEGQWLHVASTTLVNEGLLREVEVVLW